MKFIFEEFLDQTRYIYRSMLLTVLLVVLYLFVKENRGSISTKIKSVIRDKWTFLFLCYSAFLLTSMVIGRERVYPLADVFKNIGIRRGDTAWNTEIVKNILVFIPYVFLYLEAFSPSDDFRRALILSVYSTLFVELSQLLSWLGYFQIADLLHNTIGGMIGWGIWKIIHILKSKKKQR